MEKNILNFKFKERTRATTLVDVPHQEQIKLVNELYMEPSHLSDLHKQLMAEIRRKRNGYKGQDVRRDLFDSKSFISFETIVEKLVASRLRCVYCHTKIQVFYSKVRSATQWSLDRIDNNCGHSGENIVISCLGCNLHRRRIDYEKFKFTKELKLVKGI